MTDPNLLQNNPEPELLRTAGIALAILSLGAIAFLGTYVFSGILYRSAPAQTAAVIIPMKPAPFASTTIIAKGAYMEDVTTGTTLYAQNATAQLALASLTKVALVLSVIEALPSDTLVSTPASYDVPPLGGTSRLPAGQTWKLGDAINFILTASSDDGADLLATVANDAIHQRYPDSPVQNATTWRMNQLVQQLGLTNTYYLNDTGLDISTTQSGAYGSARDMATLFAYAASTSLSTFSATTRSTVRVYSSTGVAATAINTDTALEQIPGISMGKTGYTDLAGGNLAVVFNTGGHTIVAVVLGSTEDGRFTDMEQLVHAARTAIAEGY